MPPKTLLVIEPGEAERNELAEVFKRLGYEVELASGSSDGLRTFGDRNPDLVVVEVLISGINGLKVCKLIKEQGERWGVKVIVVSKVYKSRAMEYDAINRYKADAYFSRPFPIMSLVEEVIRLIGEPDPGERAKAMDKQAKKEKPAEPIMPPEPPSHQAPPSPPPPPPPPPEPELSVSHSPAPQKLTPEPQPLVIDDHAISGEVDYLGLASLLMRLSREHFFGAILLQNQNETKNVFVIDGRAVFVQSSNRDESLGRMLLDDGALTETQYRDAMVQMGESGKKFGTIVVQLGYLNNDELYYQLVSQTRRKLARCFAWSRCEYHLDRETRYPANAPTFESEFIAAILDGYRQYLDPALLETAYNRDKSKFLFAGEPSGVATVRPYLSSVEAMLLDGADGTRNLGAVVGEGSLGYVETLRLIYALAAMGAVRLAEVAKQPDLSPYETELPPQPEQPEADPRDEAHYREIKEIGVRLDSMTLFEIMELSHDSDEDAVNKAYLAQRKKYNPNQLSPFAPGRVKRLAAAIMQRLEEAYDTLSDPRRRREYLHELEAAPAGKELTEDDKEKESRLAYQEGIIALEMREYGKAAVKLKKASELSPKNVDCLAKLAEAMFQQILNPPFSYNDVEEVAKKALVFDQSRPDVIAMIGRVKSRQGDDVMAVKYLKKALDLDPQNEEIRRELHYAEQRTKEEDPKKKSFFGKLK